MKKSGFKKKGYSNSLCLTASKMESKHDSLAPTGYKKDYMHIRILSIK